MTLTLWVRWAQEVQMQQLQAPPPAPVPPQPDPSFVLPQPAGGNSGLGNLICPLKLHGFSVHSEQETHVKRARFHLGPRSWLRSLTPGESLCLSDDDTADL